MQAAFCTHGSMGFMRANAHFRQPFIPVPVTHVALWFIPCWKRCNQHQPSLPAPRASGEEGGSKPWASSSRLSLPGPKAEQCRGCAFISARSQLFVLHRRESEFHHYFFPTVSILYGQKVALMWPIPTTCLPGYCLSRHSQSLSRELK